MGRALSLWLCIELCRPSQQPISTQAGRLLGEGCWIEIGAAG